LDHRYQRIRYGTCFKNDLNTNNSIVGDNGIFFHRKRMFGFKVAANQSLIEDMLRSQIKEMWLFSKLKKIILREYI